MVEKFEVKRELKPVSKNNLINRIMYKSNKHCSQHIRKKINEIILSLLIKDLDSIRSFSYEGLPDEMPILRSIIWKINLKYLNTDIDRWDYYLNKRRNEYLEFKEAFKSKLEMEKVIFEEIHKEEESQNSYKSKILLEIDKDIIEYAKKDRKILEDIDKDIRRTHSYLNFFYMPSKKGIEIKNEELEKIIEKKKCNDMRSNSEELYDSFNRKWETNSEVMLRILFIYAKRNPNVSYVQGMNEILAPIYYCFFSEEENSCGNKDQKIIPDEIDIKKDEEYMYIADVEADTFWAFSNIMDEIKEMFIQDKDNKQGGVFSKLNTFAEILKIVDKDLFNHFKKINLDLQLITFKWVVLLFTQEFMMADILRLWDTILSDNDIYFMIFLICLSILDLKRKALLKSDFAGVISKLQKVNDLECEQIILNATKIKEKFEKKIKKVMT